MKSEADFYISRLLNFSIGKGGLMFYDSTALSLACRDMSSSLWSSSWEQKLGGGGTVAAVIAPRAMAVNAATSLSLLNLWPCGGSRGPDDMVLCTRSGWCIGSCCGWIQYAGHSGVPDHTCTLVLHLSSRMQNWRGWAPLVYDDDLYKTQSTCTVSCGLSWLILLHISLYT